MGEYATQESEWKARALTAEAECGRLREQLTRACEIGADAETEKIERGTEIIRLRERVEQLQTALSDLTPSNDGGGYGPNNAEAWKDAYIDRLREALDAERLARRLREQLDAARQALEAILSTGAGEWNLLEVHRIARAALLTEGLPARAALGVEGPQPDQGSAPTENVGRARDEEPS